MAMDGPDLLLHKESGFKRFFLYLINRRLERVVNDTSSVWEIIVSGSGRRQRSVDSVLYRFQLRRTKGHAGRKFTLLLEQELTERVEKRKWETVFR